MKIEVGSEWINSRDARFTIKAIDEDKLFIKYHTGEHKVISKEVLMAYCKPAPKRRTVVLNVYEHHVSCHRSKERADECICGGILFQQEVEIIDPRENSDA